MMINHEQVTEVLTENKTTEAFATYAACRERNARGGITSIPGIQHQMLKEGFNPIPEELNDMFKDLEKIGVGKLQGNLFKWHMPIRTLGEISQSAIKSPEVIETKPKIPMTLVVCFGKDREISITYQERLTRDEINFVVSKLLQETTK